MKKGQDYFEEPLFVQNSIIEPLSELPDIQSVRSNIAVLDPFVLRKVQLSFLDELAAGLKNTQSSLPFIRHKIAPAALVELDEIFQVMVIGGSVFRTAMIQKTKEQLFIFDTAEEQLPTFLTKADFLEFIDLHLNKQISSLAVNFAYPLDPVFEAGRADGILLTAMKEHSFEGLIGERVGKSIEQFLEEKYRKEFIVSLANDTVCLLLSGLTRHIPGEIAGGILGTGTNFAFFLENGELINLESSNFNQFPLSEELKIIDKKSHSPNNALFEKEIAGGYLYKHFNVFLKKYQLPYPPLQSTLQLKMLAEKDIPFLSSFALLLIEKSAALIAAEITAIALFKDNPALTFVMDGSFFWDDLYQTFLKKHLHVLMPNNTIRFIKIENGVYLGGAKLLA